MVTAEQIIDNIRSQSEQGELDELLQAIRAQVTSEDAPISTSVTERLEAARAHQRSLWETPVVGKRKRLKRILYQMLFFVFHRQYWINGDLTEAINLLHQNQQRMLDSRGQLQESIDRLIALSLPPPTATLIPDARLIPSVLGPDERMLLYSMIVSLKPLLVVELSMQPGAAGSVINAAIDANGLGKWITLEAAEQSLPPVPIGQHALLLRGAITDLPDQLIDVALFDDRRDDAPRSFLGLISRMRAGGYILIHHPYSRTMRELAQWAVSSKHLLDCGIFAVAPDVPVGGLQLLRVQS